MTDKRDDSEGTRPDVPEGRYANFFQLGYSGVEFYFDFGQAVGAGSEQIHTRIIAGPYHAKTLLELLRRSVESYEETFGDIGVD